MFNRLNLQNPTLQYPIFYSELLSTKTFFRIYIRGTP